MSFTLCSMTIKLHPLQQHPQGSYLSISPCPHQQIPFLLWPSYTRAPSFFSASMTTPLSPSHLWHTHFSSTQPMDVRVPLCSLHCPSPPRHTNPCPSFNSTCKMTRVCSPALATPSQLQCLNPEVFLTFTFSPFGDLEGTSLNRFKNHVLFSLTWSSHLLHSTDTITPLICHLSIPFHIQFITMSS